MALWQPTTRQQARCQTEKHANQCGSKQFFFEKKNQKTFVIRRSRCPNAYAKWAKVFASFFKKKCFLAVDGSASRQLGIIYQNDLRWQVSPTPDAPSGRIIAMGTGRYGGAHPAMFITHGQVTAELLLALPAIAALIPL